MVFLLLDEHPGSISADSFSLKHLLYIGLFGFLFKMLQPAWIFQ